MADSSGDKKHPASERRLEEARRQGQVPRSADLTSAALLLVAVVLLRTMGPNLTTTLGGYVADTLKHAYTGRLGTSDAVGMLLRAGGVFALAVLPLCATFLLGNVALHVMQTGLLFLPEKVSFNWSHVNPLSGFQRILSLPNIARLIFGLFKLAVVSTIAYYSLQELSAEILAAAGLSASQVAKLLIETVLRICQWIGASLFVLAILDYGFQRWKYSQDMMMSDQELRDEQKDSEGDPQVAARRRQIHRQLATQRVRKEVPKADAIITNPTELAIAIKYDPKTMPAPIVLAKGAGSVAQLIRRIALEHGIPVVERKPLAQALYKTVNAGDIIPLDQYQAVAEVLRYVYKLQGRKVPTIGQRL